MALLEKRGEDQNQQWSRFWHSAAGFWRGPVAWRIWLICASLIAIVILQLYVQFRLNFWNRNFFDALERRQPEELLTQVVLLLPLCGASIALAVSSVWGRMTVQRKWREWLTTHVLGYWIDEDRYAHLARREGKRQIPEYRMSEDVRVATDAPIDFALGLLSSLMTAGIFIQVLWEVGGDAGFALSGYQIRIPGYLVVSVIVYSGVVTAAMLIVGSPLVKVIQIKNQAEAELITAGHLLRDVGEGVIPQTRGPEVKRGVSQALQKVLAQWRRLCGQLMRNTFVSHANTLLAPTAGLILCAPKFLAGSMTLGELTQAAAAFTLVQGSFNWLVDNYGRGADWISSVERVGGLLISLDELNHTVQSDQPTAVSAALEPATPLQ
jgi:vitamin B12/bleomycin/antimicrobial peptide transport system ATP-binding/permease protein